MPSSRAASTAFVEANDPDSLPERWRESVRTAVGQRMERHEHLDAVAAALREVPRSLALGGRWRPSSGSRSPRWWSGRATTPTRCTRWPLAEEYARLLPNAELVVEDEGQAPLAWQGGRLSEAIAGFLRRTRCHPDPPSSATPSGVTTSVRSTSVKPQAR